MNRFWDVAIRPLLELVEARSVVEIGAASAEHSRLIGAWCRDRGARATIIDPAPRFDPAEIHDPQAGIVLDQRPSLDALPGLDACDVALVDGDHNHYTVLRELRLLFAAARDASRPAPVVVCHDVLWPYARRDLYYDPSTIPDEHRHPWRRAGMLRGRSELVDGSGLNPHLCNAEHEGGPRNGVLTGVEDAVAELDETATLTILPVLYGLAIVVPASREAATPGLAGWIARWSEPDGLRELLALAEVARSGGDMTAQALSTPPRGRSGAVHETRGRTFRPALAPAALGQVQEGVTRTMYRGVRFLKSPFDVVLYLQAIGRIRPATIIEIGTKDGGSALWFADQQAAFLDHPPRVVSVDLEAEAVYEDPRITFLQGDALALDEVLTPELLADLPRPWLVVEDSAHTYPATTAVLEFFDRHLRSGDVLVVEDGIVADLPDAAYDRYEDGPNRAVADFLATRDGYEVDASLCDHFGHNVTWSPNGWLRRV